MWPEVQAMILLVGDNDTTKVPKPSAKAVTSGMVIALHPIFAFDSQHAIDGIFVVAAGQRQQPWM